MATTIPAGTLRLLLTSISYRAKARKEMRREPPMVPRRPPRSCCWTARRVEGARPQAAGRGKYRDRRRADRVQVETLTPQQVRRVCTADSVSALVSDLQTAGADPAGLAWSAVYCTVWHGSITGAPLHPYIPYYNRAAVLTCTTSGVALVSGTGGGAALDGMPSSVAQVVYRQFVRLLYCVRWNGSN